MTAVKLSFKAILPPSLNPTVPDTFGQRFRETLCRRVGHVRSGAITGLPQASCRRCGVKLSGAGPRIPEWRVPG